MLKCEDIEAYMDWEFDCDNLQGDFFLYALHIFIGLLKNSREIIQLTPSAIIKHHMRKSSNPRDLFFFNSDSISYLFKIL